MARLGDGRTNEEDAEYRGTMKNFVDSKFMWVKPRNSHASVSILGTDTETGEPYLDAEQTSGPDSSPLRRLRRPHHGDT